MSTPSVAANAYASLARLTDPQQGLTRAVGEGSSGPSFGAMLKEAVNAINQTSRASDTQTQAIWRFDRGMCVQVRSAGGAEHLSALVPAVGYLDVCFR